ncbi:hypothetical protein RHSIM_Rhsim06G0151000 [Rhododendron simsii]|uniref:At1g61320/AtMIF1 LRR domain-containing protein n=1 Tax=Rhododendron simsii TaxID=118357 RepID=A0A834GVV1_RHOSS|nr:hypothetical protein RHSIM_Rhsim06G0151000 [Rhododendron simsii]
MDQQHGVYTLPSHLLHGARDFILRMLVVDPMKRITIPEIRQHLWFKARLPRYLAVQPPDSFQPCTKKDSAIPIYTVSPNGSMSTSRYNTSEDKRWVPKDNNTKSPARALEDKASVQRQIPGVRSGHDHALPNWLVTPLPKARHVTEKKSEPIVAPSESTMQAVECSPAVSAPKVDFATDLFNMLSMDGPSINTSEAASTDANSWAGVQSAAEASRINPTMGLAAGELYFDFGISRSPTATASNNDPTTATASSAAGLGQLPFLFPSLPLPFGCFPSPQSSYPLLSSSLLFLPSKTAGQLGNQPFPEDASDEPLVERLFEYVVESRLQGFWTGDRNSPICSLNMLAGRLSMNCTTTRGKWYNLADPKLAKRFFQFPGMMTPAAGNNELLKYMQQRQMGNMGSTLQVGTFVPFPSARYFPLSFKGHIDDFINQMRSVLAKRWRYMWLYVPCLKFSPMKMSRSKEVAFINQSLLLRKGPTIQKFSLSFLQPDAERHHVDSWIYFAKTRNVNEFNLDFSDIRQVISSVHRSSTSVTVLSLVRCEIHFPVKFKLSSLKTLSLEQVYFSGGEINDLTDSTSILESLSLTDCKGFTNL